MGQKEEETLRHVFSHFGKAQILWNLLFDLFRLSWVMEETVSKMMEAWSSAIRKRGKEEHEKPRLTSQLD